MSEELRARDVLRSLPERPVLGHRLAARVGGRGWLPPRFASGRRLFAKCGLPDPWDPDVVSEPIALGDVGLAARKAVAPHASAPTHTAPASAAAAVPPWVGQRSTASATPAVKAPALPPRAAPAATPPPPAKPPPSTFGSAPRPALGKLPVRPDLDATQPGGGKGGAPTPRPPEPAPRVHAGDARGGPRFATVPRRGVGTDGPQEIAVPPPAPEVREPPVAAPAAPARTTPASLDDLFGMGEGTRVRLPPKGAEEPRRTKVTDASQVQGGVDRRPPMLKKD